MEKNSGFKQKKDICLWIVDGKSNVRKFRLTYLKIGIFALFFCILGAMLFTIAGDYTRVQTARFKNYILLKKIDQQRLALERSNLKLEDELMDLRTINARVLEYEKDVKNKLLEIAKVIESATSLAVLDEDEDSDMADPLEEAGVGGAERDLEAAEREINLRGRLDPAFFAAPQQFSFNLTTPRRNDNFLLPNEELPEKIDKLVSLIKELPLGNPAIGKITSGFGRRVSPFTRRLTVHEGIDLSLQSGTPILATANGKVKSAANHPTYGLVVDIEHNERIVTRYAHLSKILVKQGQRVKLGDKIGLSGSTGRSTGPHLHYEVLLDGKANNPKNFLGLKNNIREVL